MEQKLHTSSSVTKKVSFSIIAISLPLIFVSLLHIPLSSLSNDTTFWFLISNSIIFIVASIDSSKFTNNEYDMYNEYVNHSKKNHAIARSYDCVHDSLPNSKKLEEPNQEIKKVEIPLMNVDDKTEQNKKEEDLSTMAANEGAKERKEEGKVISVKEESAKCGRSKSELGKRREVRSRMSRSRTCAMEENIEYMKMSNEELNKRVEEFIKRFNTEIWLEERMIQTSVC